MISNLESVHILSKIQHRWLFCHNQTGFRKRKTSEKSANVAWHAYSYKIKLRLRSTIKYEVSRMTMHVIYTIRLALYFYIGNE